MPGRELKLPLVKVGPRVARDVPGERILISRTVLVAVHAFIPIGPATYHAGYPVLSNKDFEAGWLPIHRLFGPAGSENPDAPQAPEPRLGGGGEGPGFQQPDPDGGISRARHLCQ